MALMCRRCSGHALATPRGSPSGTISPTIPRTCITTGWASRRRETAIMCSSMCILASSSSTGCAFPPQVGNGPASSGITRTLMGSSKNRSGAGCQAVSSSTVPNGSFRPGRLAGTVLPRQAHGDRHGEQDLLIHGQINPTVQIRPGEMQFWRIGHVGAMLFIKFRIEGMPLYVVVTDVYPPSQPRKWRVLRGGRMKILRITDKCLITGLLYRLVRGRCIIPSICVCPTTLTPPLSRRSAPMCGWTNLYTS
jgi:hypothetical protein